MYSSTVASAVLLALVSQATAATIRIDVGQSGFVFTPATVKANKGDILEYHFHPGNHSVVQSDFSNPCNPAKTGGFYSGFIQNNEAAQVFQVTVNSTDPMFFYCAQTIPGVHCALGMSGVVNPSNDQTLAAYQKASSSVSSASNPPSVFGGKFLGASSSSSASTSQSATGSAKGTGSPTSASGSATSGTGSPTSGTGSPTSATGSSSGSKTGSTAAATTSASVAGAIQASGGIVGFFALAMAALLM